MNDAAETLSLSEFHRGAKTHLARLKKTGRPEILTVDGKPRAVVLGTAAYRRLLDRIEEAEAIAGIERGLESMERGEGRPMREALVDIRRKHRIPRTA